MPRAMLRRPGVRSRVQQQAEALGINVTVLPAVPIPSTAADWAAIGEELSETCKRLWSQFSPRRRGRQGSTTLHLAGVLKIILVVYGKLGEYRASAPKRERNFKPGAMAENSKRCVHWTNQFCLDFGSIFNEKLT